MSTQFKVQVRRMDDRLLTEWYVGENETGADVNVVREIEWLRQVAGDSTDATNASLLAREPS